MRKSVAIILVVIFSLAAYSAMAGMKEDIESKIAQNFKNNGVANPVVNAELVKKLENSDVYIVKLNVRGDNLKKVLQQYVLSDGNYIYPEAIEMASGQKILEEFKAEANKVSFTPEELDKMVFTKGTKGAKNVIVVADDFECPFCRRAHFYMKDILKNIPEDNYAFYVLNYPLSIHKKSKLFAKIHYAAIKTGRNLMDEIFNYTGKGDFKSKSNEEIIEFFANKTKNPDKFKKLVSSKEAEENLKWNMNKGQSLNINGTPAIFINGKRINGFNQQKITEYLNQIK